MHTTTPSPNTDLEVAFELVGEPAEVPCSVDAKQECALRPVHFLFTMQAFLKLQEKAIPGDSKLQFRTDTRTTNEANSQKHRLGQLQGGFTFGF